eukprot:Skav230789  [mRNA]  locus=scaffold1168:65204:65560:- [translate_table: standard]
MPVTCQSHVSHMPPDLGARRSDVAAGSEAARGAAAPCVHVTTSSDFPSLSTEEDAKQLKLRLGEAKTVAVNRKRIAAAIHRQIASLRFASLRWKADEMQHQTDARVQHLMDLMAWKLS